MAQYICGKNSVKEAIENKVAITEIYCDKNIKINFPKDIKVSFVSKFELDKLTKENHQGVVAMIKEFNYQNLDKLINDKPNRVLILDHLQDPHNFGAIMRSANAFGVNHIIIPKDRSVSVTPTVLKVSSGGFVNMNVVRVGSLVDAIQKLRKNGFWIYASALENSKSIDDISFNDNAVIVIGNEAKGVSNSILKQSDEIFRINMKGTVQSLNASVAAGIILSKL